MKPCEGEGFILRWWHNLQCVNEWDFHLDDDHFHNVSTIFLQSSNNISTKFLQYFYNISTIFPQYFYDISNNISTIFQQYFYNVCQWVRFPPWRRSFPLLSEVVTSIQNGFSLTGWQPTLLDLIETLILLVCLLCVLAHKRCFTLLGEMCQYHKCGGHTFWRTGLSGGPIKVSCHNK